MSEKDNNGHVMEKNRGDWRLLVYQLVQNRIEAQGGQDLLKSFLFSEILVSLTHLPRVLKAFLDQKISVLWLIATYTTYRHARHAQSYNSVYYTWIWVSLTHLTLWFIYRFLALIPKKNILKATVHDIIKAYPNTY
jgi:hypothetical protein